MAGYTYPMPTASFRIDHHNVPNGISGWLATHIRCLRHLSASTITMYLTASLDGWLHISDAYGI
ncbi:MAG: hypothetical protein IJK87_06755, partial [Prevotella sp.]|nr:hypothetical protein [Prevotella sp.]